MGLRTLTWVIAVFLLTAVKSRNFIQTTDQCQLAQDDRVLPMLHPYLCNAAQAAPCAAQPRRPECERRAASAQLATAAGLRVGHLGSVSG
jgi:hypothetical protein